jgi:hypothetical protein
MKQGIAAISALALALAALSACRDYMPTNRYLQPRSASSTNLSTADASRKFDHERHAKVLQQQGVTCVSCHRFDAQIGGGEPQLASAFSSAAQYPGSAACHYCHGPSDTHIASAPSACTTCHQNLTPLMPENHQIAWERVHASVASADPVACQNCHRDSFCINCHQSRDSILTVMHERDYLSYHSVDARSNPMQCGNCHREDFCANCHAQAIK